MKIKLLADKVEKHINPILDESGSIVFSSVDTIKKGDIYILGLNPGGEIFIPIKRTLEELPLRHKNAYLDEIWGNRRNPKYPQGKHPLQANLTILIQSIGYNPRTVFSSNLIFTRSRGQKGSLYTERTDICWKVHQEFIKIIDPKCFIVFGNSKISPFQYIKDKYILKISDSINSGHGKWQCFSCTGIIEGKERLLIGLPHLSRYYINKHPNVIEWITSKISIVL